MLQFYSKNINYSNHEHLSTNQYWPESEWERQVLTETEVEGKEKIQEQREKAGGQGNTKEGHVNSMANPNTEKYVHNLLLLQLNIIHY